jgi:alkylhydroperoxidase family enzyme
MGHSEMSLAVAGQTPEQIKERTRRLADDWSAFTPAERQAFALACQLSRDPKAVTAADRAALVKTFGAERAVDIIWHASWCNYMTRVADAFQLPLEQENVFMPPPATGGTSRDGKVSQPPKP